MIVASAVLGLIIGSFLNVVAYRVPLGKSVVAPPSACTSCGHRLAPKDNIPLVSWVALRGRCRYCGARISIRYPIVEAATALAFAGTAWLIGPRWILVPYLWFVGVTIVLTLTDLDHQRIPNRILYPSTIVGAVLLTAGALLDGDNGAFLLRALEGGLVYFALLFLVALAARGGFGMGDVKLAFFLGLYLTYASWGTLIVGIFLAFVVGGLGALLLLVTRLRGRKDPVAFGPSLVAGAWIAIPFAQALLDWYLRV